MKFGYSWLEALGVTEPYLPATALRLHSEATWLKGSGLDWLSAEAARAPGDFRFGFRHGTPLPLIMT